MLLVLVAAHSPSPMWSLVDGQAERSACDRCRFGRFQDRLAPFGVHGEAEGVESRPNLGFRFESRHRRMKSSEPTHHCSDCPFGSRFRSFASQSRSNSARDQADPCRSKTSAFVTMLCMMSSLSSSFDVLGRVRPFWESWQLLLLIRICSWCCGRSTSTQ